ncbi:hypothetical protein GGS23DRAFT_545314 [Durotheca rogersii]|uniref:uncharacterized protein n=1 Tax=Durotheca rogersii TaxID=419775 RepID=UPI00221EEA2D|nr:uncharacterized protein GGS23DRAFT_545314 [Durotheca rogersii]KAI5868406.1 hypothetical protein GGS23DRAFT_545314 [Durotheca rogersii]
MASSENSDRKICTKNRSLVCERHGLWSCLVCLHHIDLGGQETPYHPDYVSWIPCSESDRGVEPLFEKFVPDDELDAHSGGRKTNRGVAGSKSRRPMTAGYCSKCGFSWMASDELLTTTHPSHICADGHRYMTIIVDVASYKRKLGDISCEAVFLFGPEPCELRFRYEVVTPSDDGTADWNLDNSQIASLWELMLLVKKCVMPDRAQQVREVVFTNSAHFAHRAAAFRLLVAAHIDPALLKFLLKAHKLKYSRARRAFVQTRMGFVTRKYPTTPIRRFHVARFVICVMELAAAGVQVFWVPCRPSSHEKAARAAFMDDPYQRKIPDPTPGPVEEDEVERLGGYFYDGGDDGDDDDEDDTGEPELEAARHDYAEEELLESDSLVGLESFQNYHAPTVEDELEQ